MDPIILEPYSPDWPFLFKELGQRIREKLGRTAIRIDHIGSTSIPNMSAKPIIDVQISVEALQPTDPFRGPLEELGFIFRKDNIEKTKRYFREKPGERRTHIHVRKIGSWHQQYPLLFRDYLRKNDLDARLYENEKTKLAELYRDNRVAYVEGKMKIFWEIMYRADRWALFTGWEPEESDE